MSLTGAHEFGHGRLDTTQGSVAGSRRITCRMRLNRVCPREAVLVTAALGRAGAVISEIRREVDATLKRMSRLANFLGMTQYQSISGRLTSYTSYLGQPRWYVAADRFNDFPGTV